MENVSRREVLKAAAGAAITVAATPLLGRGESPAATKAAAPTPWTAAYCTCFYQFDRRTIASLIANGLPTADDCLHLFTHSHPGFDAFPDYGKFTHAFGPAFKYGMAIDLHKYKLADGTPWHHAPDPKLLEWAKQFRAIAHASGADYFAFNELPTGSAENPDYRRKSATWLRYLNDPGDGAKLRGVFYLTEKCEIPAWWQPDDDFWSAVDETCDLFGAEHFHNWPFVMEQPVEKLTAHLFAMAEYLKSSGKPAQVSIAERKYSVLHSSYYGPAVTAWAGLQTPEYSPEQLLAYYRRCIAATRASALGKTRITFSPLVTRGEDPRGIAVLGKALGEDYSAMKATTIGGRPDS